MLTFLSVHLHIFDGFYVRLTEDPNFETNWLPVEVMTAACTAVFLKWSHVSFLPSFQGTVCSGLFITRSIKTFHQPRCCAWDSFQVVKVTFEVHLNAWLTFRFNHTVFAIEFELAINWVKPRISILQFPHEALATPLSICTDVSRLRITRCHIGWSYLHRATQRLSV